MIDLGDTHLSYHQDSESWDGVVSLQIARHGKPDPDSPRTNLEYIVRGRVQVNRLPSVLNQ